MNYKLIVDTFDDEAEIHVKCNLNDEALKAAFQRGLKVIGISDFKNQYITQDQIEKLEKWLPADSLDLLNETSLTKVNDLYMYSHTHDWLGLFMDIAQIGNPALHFTFGDTTPLLYINDLMFGNKIEND